VRDDLNDPERLAWEKTQHTRALGGDRAAFTALYQAYAKLVFVRVLMPKLGQVGAAEDALSETFRTAFERLGQFEARQTSIYFWFAKIAEHKALDMHRARAVTGRAIVNLQEQFSALVPQALGADAQLAAHEQEQRVKARLSACMTELNPRYRAALELRFYQERERAECAEALGVSVPTFDVLLLRALRALRKLWQAQSADSKEPPSER
jgi:RNA polymerase sigma-70 factor (ECF subfamily)